MMMVSTMMHDDNVDGDDDKDGYHYYDGDDLGNVDDDV